MTGQPVLPDLSALADVPQRSWRALGRRLTEVGFGAGFCNAMWQGPPDAYPWLHRPVSAWRARQSDQLPNVVYRLFCLGEPVASELVDAALTQPLAGALRAARLLEASAAQEIRSVLDLRVAADHFVFCDRLELGGDAVFGIGEGNLAFTGIVSSRWPAGLAVDVGCGAGATALAASRHASRVLATDINPRAVALTRINAAVNGVDNIETTSGDLLDPLAGMRFDLLLAQPPFVPEPPDTSATYQFGGPSGDRLTRRLMADVPQYLRKGGRAGIVYEAAVGEDGTDLDPWAALPVRPGISALRLRGLPVHADVYATRYALPHLRAGAVVFDAAAARMRDHLAATGIAAIRPALAVFERVEESAGWLDTIEVDGHLWDQIEPESVWRILRGVSAAHNAETDLQLELPAGALIVDSAADPNSVHVALPPGQLARTQLWQRAELDRLRSGQVLDAGLRRRALRAGFIRTGNDVLS